MRRPKRIIILRSADGLDEHLSRLRAGPLAVDTETTGFKWQHGDLVGSINLAAGKTAVFAYKEALGPVARWLSNEVKANRELVFHNAKFDLHHLRSTFGLRVPYPVHNTHAQSFLVDNRGANAFRWRTKKPHDLKELAAVYVDPDAKDNEKELMTQIRALGGRNLGDWLLANEEVYATYAAMDSWYTLQLHKGFVERIRHWVQPSEHYPPLWFMYDLEMRVTRALVDMEERGIMANREFLERWRIEELEPKLKKVTDQLDRIARKRRRDINWNAPAQIASFLFDARPHGLGLQIKKRSEKTKQPSTDGSTLLDLDHAIGPLIVQYRETFKQWSSYAVSLVDAICADGAIRPNIKSTGAETGRTSCEDPNLQQQTRTSGVRKAYHPRKGLVFRMADYSQIEMRLAAHFGNETALIEGFCNDPDFDTHVATALKMFGKRFNPKTQHRKYAKILNFTTIFGGGENKVAEQLIDLMEYDEAIAGCREFGHRHLAPGTNPWRVLAHELKVRYKKEMPHLIKALRDDARQAEARGYAMHDYGGHRFFDDRWYRAFNTRVQGTAGVRAKIGLVNTHEEVQLIDKNIGLMLIIHDELFYESEGSPKVDRKVLQLMAEMKRFKVPIIADMSGSAKNWQDKEKIKL